MPTPKNSATNSAAFSTTPEEVLVAASVAAPVVASAAAAVTTPEVPVATPETAAAAPAGAVSSAGVRWRRMMTGKIHRATVTGADLNYVGSITIDSDLLTAADILPGEAVDVVDIANGNRLTTYAIPGEPGSGIINVNGAAAHLVKRGDLVIIIAYSQLEDAVARSYEPRVVFVDGANREIERGAEPGQVPAENTAGLHSSGISFAAARA